MKIKYLKKIIISLVFVFATSFSFAQMMSPQDPGNGPTGSDPPVGGGAPISGGIIVLLTLGAAYGGKKVVDLAKKTGQDTDL